MKTLAVGSWSVVGAIVACCCIPLDDTGSNNSTGSAPRAIATAEVQAQRMELIAGLQRNQIIQKIDTPGSIPRVYVLPAFYGLTFEDKQLAISVCHAYAHKLPKGSSGESLDITSVYDAMTNNRIGDYNTRLGGLDLD